MTEQELLKLDRVGLADAAAYLQNGTKPLDIRVWAQTGTCPFCQCCYLSPSSKRRIYRIHVGNLIVYKNGGKLQPMPPLGYGCKAGGKE